VAGWSAGVKRALIRAVFAAAVAQAARRHPGVAQTQQVLSGSVKSSEATTNDLTPSHATDHPGGRRRAAGLEGYERGPRLLCGLDTSETSRACPHPGGRPRPDGHHHRSGDVQGSVRSLQGRRSQASQQVILPRLQLASTPCGSSGAKAISVGGVAIGPNVTIRPGRRILVDFNRSAAHTSFLAVGPPRTPAGGIRPQRRLAADVVAGDKLLRRGQRQRSYACRGLPVRFEIQLRHAEWA